MGAERITERSLIQHMHRLFPGGTGVRLGIGDDCAVLEPEPEVSLLVTTDLLLEEIHFRGRYATAGDIGWKALAVNLSDIAAMGGVPRWAVVALACPADVTPAAVDDFGRAMRALAAEHDVAVVGGDTARSPRGWIVNVTLVGAIHRAPKLRSGAHPGDVIAVTGPLGRSAAGLARLALSPDERDELALTHLRPVPRVREGQALGSVDGVTAMIDLSDGLATDLGHIAERSGVGARVELSRLPIDLATREAARILDADATRWATSGGEDYELLVTVRPEALGEALSQVALTVIGEITEAGPVCFVAPDGSRATVSPGFEHFVTTAASRSPCW